MRCRPPGNLAESSTEGWHDYGLLAYGAHVYVSAKLAKQVGKVAGAQVAGCGNCGVSRHAALGGS